MRVLVIANRVDPDLGLVGDALSSHDATFDRVWREDEGALPDPGSHDLVVSLGSAWSVYDPAHAVPVGREAAHLRACSDAEVPVLGICFGGQMHAHALGGSVERSSRAEIGWYDVTPTEVAGSAGMEPGPYLQWHVDRFTVPPGATELARNDAGPQAFVRGSALGLQFHPEATTSMIERWVASEHNELVEHDVDGALVLAETKARQDEASGRATRLVEAFLDGGFRSIG